MKKNILILLIIPLFVSAAGVTDLIDAAFSLVTDILIPLAFALALLYFFWGVVKYIKEGANSEEAAREGKKVMIWGVVGLFVAFSVLGIIEFIKGELGIPYIQEINAPLQQYVTGKFIPVTPPE